MFYINQQPRSRRNVTPSKVRCLVESPSHMETTVSEIISLTSSQHQAILAAPHYLHPASGHRILPGSENSHSNTSTTSTSDRHNAPRPEYPLWLHLRILVLVTTLQWIEERLHRHELAFADPDRCPLRPPGIDSSEQCPHGPGRATQIEVDKSSVCSLPRSFCTLL